MRYIPARPTTYCGVRMRSRLEAFAASVFDECGSLWEYEPQCFADETGQYLPDFYVLDPVSNHGGEYIEIKPLALFADKRAVEAEKARMARIWSSEPEAKVSIMFMAQGDYPMACLTAVKGSAWFQTGDDDVESWRRGM